MDAEGRRLLAELVDEALTDGFDRIEIEREVREGAPGWRMRIGGGPARDTTGEKWLLEAAMADNPHGYLGEVSHLFGLWVRFGIPEEHRAGVGRNALPHALGDLGFFVAAFSRGTDRQREIALELLHRGLDPFDVARAFREAFEVPEAA